MNTDTGVGNVYSGLSGSGGEVSTGCGRVAWSLLRRLCVTNPAAAVRVPQHLAVGAMLKSIIRWMISQSV